MKEEFLKLLDYLLENCKYPVELTEDMDKYITKLRETKSVEITENGKQILSYMQQNPAESYKARDIAEGLFINSRSVSGAMRKLITSGFVSKEGQEPVIYKITNLGKEYKI